MKKFFRLLAVVTWLGGWALAASALHVVRTPSTVTVVPKDRIGFAETYVDVRAWTPAEVATHPAVTKRLIATGKADQLGHVAPAIELERLLVEGPPTIAKPVDVPVPAPSPATVPVQQVKSNSIFD